MTQSQTCISCLLLAVVWISIMAVLAYVNWPHLPLDLSPVDPSTIAAMRQAVLKHVAVYAAVAVIPLLILWLVLRWRRAGSAGTAGESGASRE